MWVKVRARARNRVRVSVRVREARALGLGLGLELGLGRSHLLVSLDRILSKSGALIMPLSSVAHKSVPTLGFVLGYV